MQPFVRVLEGGGKFRGNLNIPSVLILLILLHIDPFLNVHNTSMYREIHTMHIECCILTIHNIRSPKKTLSLLDLFV